LKRLDSQRTLLAKIEARRDLDADALQATITAFAELRQVFGTAPDSLLDQAQRELLVTTCTLGAAAAQQRLDAMRAEATARRNSGSAAAGALMLFDRACSALGCSDK
jgi:hypothetical protein